jgi:hypothetical protein
VGRGLGVGEGDGAPDQEVLEGGTRLTAGSVDGDGPAQAESQRVRQTRDRRLFIAKRKPVNRRMAAGRRGRLLNGVYEE